MQYPFGSAPFTGCSTRALCFSRSCLALLAGSSMSPIAGACEEQASTQAGRRPLANRWSQKVHISLDHVRNRRNHARLANRWSQKVHFSTLASGRSTE